MEDNTTYKLSFWPGPMTSTKPIIPEGNLIFSDCPFNDETTHKVSKFMVSLIKSYLVYKICKTDELPGQLVHKATEQDHTVS